MRISELIERLRRLRRPFVWLTAVLVILLCLPLAWVVSMPLLAPLAPLEERYPGPWREDMPPLPVLRLLAGASAPCPELGWQPSTTHRGEYLVMCTTDGVRWALYQAWTPGAELEGPFDPATAAPGLGVPHH